jgi:tetratricopeptide (TPR) repeat protein
MQYYDKALAIDPKDKEALNGKGNALDWLGNYAQDIQYYDKALRYHDMAIQLISSVFRQYGNVRLVLIHKTSPLVGAPYALLK